MSDFDRAYQLGLRHGKEFVELAIKVNKNPTELLEEWIEAQK